MPDLRANLASTLGVAFFTMPFIEGESLPARLTRSGEFQEIRYAAS
jgi:hypothetical protein